MDIDEKMRRLCQGNEKQVRLRFTNFDVDDYIGKAKVCFIGGFFYILITKDDRLTTSCSKILSNIQNGHAIHVDITMEDKEIKCFVEYSNVPLQRGKPNSTSVLICSSRTSVAR